ncbi:uncharacterized protein [Coffea arabica]|uniref:CCHC-type domain-containing protein n=1 Tax=Coffea arabica TaxID=13443 RepID=A0ABM4W554_COFAR
MASRMIFLKPWTPDLDVKKMDLESIPVWIRLPHLKLHYYTETNLSKFASFVGNSLYTDKQSADQSPVAYARICVELHIDTIRPDSIPYINEHGQLEYQEIEYEWNPPSCLKCQKFGHLVQQCPLALQASTKWMPKATSQSETGYKQDTIRQILVPDELFSPKPVESVAETITEQQGEQKEDRLETDNAAEVTTEQQGKQTEERLETDRQHTQQTKELYSVALKRNAKGTAKMEIQPIGMVNMRNSYSPLDNTDNSQVIEVQDEKLGGGARKKWQLFRNGVPGSVSRIWVAWNSSIVHCSLLIIHQQAISYLVDTHEGQIFILTIVYGANKTEQRKGLWQHLRQIWATIGNSPWLIFGDFNAIRTSTERIGCSDFDLGAMEDFNNCLDALDVIEYPSKGCFFTWCNTREVEDKIYRELIGF